MNEIHKELVKINENLEALVDAVRRIGK